MPDEFSFEEFLQRVNVLEKEVSRRKELEEELRASKEWYETLAQLSPVGIFRTDADGRCLYVNRRWCEIAGLSPQDARGEGWIRGLHPEDRERVALEWSDAARNEKPFHSEYRFQSSGGRTTWVIGNAAAFRNPGGKRLGYVGTITDITERKSAESAVKENEERLRAVVGLMPVMLDAFDAQGNLCAWNRECERVTGYGADEILGNPRAMDLLYPDPAYRGRMMAAWAERGDDYYDWEWDLRAKDGTIKTVAWSNIAKRFPIPGWATWGVGVDVTARKRAESALGERVKELTCLYALSRIVATPDLSLEEMLQEAVTLLPPACQYPEVTCGRIVVEDREYMTAGFQETPWKLASEIMVRDEPVGVVQVHYLEEKPELFQGPFLREERELIDEIASRLAEAMERKRAEEDKALMMELGTKKEELERFAHTVSHDLKSPLITIKGFLNLIERVALAGDRERTKTYLTRAVETADRMARRLDDLLELSRVGRLVNADEEIVFGDLAREAVNMVEGQLATRGVHVEIEPEFPIVRGDGDRIREVLENLLDNAAKFMGNQPEPRVRVGVRHRGKEPVFFVQDNGQGIAAGDQAIVFGLFTRLNSGTKGTGAGLAIAKRIIEAHGGKIWVESEGPEKGTTVCFSLGPAMPRNPTNQPRP